MGPVIAYRGDVYSPTMTTNVYVAAWNGSVWDTSFGNIGDPTSKFRHLAHPRGTPRHRREYRQQQRRLYLERHLLVRHLGRRRH